MSEMEDKLGAILGNPQMMQQIMSLAQSMGQNSPSPETVEKKSQEAPPSLVPDFDPAMIRKLTSLAGKANIDKDQQLLLRALRPYLSKARLNKLEKAMRAAKMAQLAGLAIQSGR